MSTIVEDKTRALLVAGAVTVTGVDQWGVTATVKGYTAAYRTSWAPTSGWRCTCPERRGRCSHIAAVQRVTGIVDGRGWDDQ